MRDNYIDNYALFEMREREYNEWLDRRPVCDVCGEPIQDDHYYDIFHKNVCPACMEDFKRDIWED